MTSKKGKIISFAMEPEFQAVLKAQAEKKKVSVSAVVRDLVQKYLMTDAETTKIVLHLPNDVLTSSENLEQWLNQRVRAIVHHFKDGSR